MMLKLVISRPRVFPMAQITGIEIPSNIAAQKYRTFDKLFEFLMA
jgi:hypothetical protein